MNTMHLFGIWIAALTMSGNSLLAAEPSGGNATNRPTRQGEKNIVVFAEPGSFAGWPANNGAWTWNDGKEILVGFTKGPFVEQEGHNIGKTDRKNLLARSTDGGTTWSTEEPSNFVGHSAKPVASPGNIHFETPSFAMRVMADGYHGSSDKAGSFFVSDDKGKNWRGPYRFNGLMEDPNLAGTECTSRTGYLVTGPESCLIFMAARPKDFKKGEGTSHRHDRWRQTLPVGGSVGQILRRGNHRWREVIPLCLMDRAAQRSLPRRHACRMPSEGWFHRRDCPC